MLVRKFPFTGGPPCCPVISCSIMVSHCFAFTYCPLYCLFNVTLFSFVSLNLAHFTFFSSKRTFLGRLLLFSFSVPLKLIVWSLQHKLKKNPTFACAVEFLVMPFSESLGLSASVVSLQQGLFVLLVWQLVYVDVSVACYSLCPWCTEAVIPETGKRNSIISHKSNPASTSTWQAFHLHRHKP